MTTASPTSAGLRSTPRESATIRVRSRGRGRTGTESARPVPRRRVSSLPFLALIAGLLGAGLLALLMINNSLAAGSFEQARFKSDSILLGEQEQALRQEVERLSSPTRVREAAREAGLIPAATTAYFDVSTGQILGVPLPAGVGADIAGAPATAVAPAPVVVDPVTGQPVTPAPGTPVAGTIPGAPAAPGAPATPATPVPPATPGAPAAPANPANPAAPANPANPDGAVVGGQPGGVTAYDRAIVSGGGR